MRTGEELEAILLKQKMLATESHLAATTGTDVLASPELAAALNERFGPFCSNKSNLWVVLPLPYSHAGCGTFCFYAVWWAFRARPSKAQSAPTLRGVCMHACIHSFVHSCMHAFIHSFVQLLLFGYPCSCKCGPDRGQCTRCHIEELRATMASAAAQMRSALAIGAAGASGAATAAAPAPLVGFQAPPSLTLVPSALMPPLLVRPPTAAALRAGSARGPPHAEAVNAYVQYAGHARKPSSQAKSPAAVAAAAKAAAKAANVATDGAVAAAASLATAGVKRSRSIFDTMRPPPDTDGPRSVGRGKGPKTCEHANCSFGRFHVPYPIGLGRCFCEILHDAGDDTGKKAAVMLKFKGGGSSPFHAHLLF